MRTCKDIRRWGWEVAVRFILLSRGRAGELETCWPSTIHLLCDTLDHTLRLFPCSWDLLELVQGRMGQVSDPGPYTPFCPQLELLGWSPLYRGRESLATTDLLTEFMNPSLALPKQWSYFLLALRDECMCRACWQTTFIVYKYHSTCSLLQREWIRFACCRQGTISSDNCYWKKSSECTSYIWPYSTIELFDKMYTHVGGWQD